MQTETACKKWLVKQIQKSPGVRTKPKDRFWNDDVRKLFPSLAERQFLRAWNDAIKEAEAPNWRKAGPTKRSDHRTS
jgi:hypothetical protein